MKRSENQYKFKFYINAGINDNYNYLHAHKWEVVLYAIREINEKTPVLEVESLILNYVERYNDSVLNNIEPFNNVSPNIENIGSVLFIHISHLLAGTSWEVTSLEISEHPSITYIINSLDDLDNRLYKDMAIPSAMPDNGLSYSLEDRHGHSYATLKKARLKKRAKIRKATLVKIGIVILITTIVVGLGVFTYTHFFTN